MKIEEYLESLMTYPNVNSVSLEKNKITVYVDKKYPKDELADEHILPEYFEEYDIDVIEEETPHTTAVYEHRLRHMPLVAGISIGGVGSNEVGTLGVILEKIIGTRYRLKESEWYLPSLMVPLFSPQVLDRFFTKEHTTKAYGLTNAHVVRDFTDISQPAAFDNLQRQTIGTVSFKTPQEKSDIALIEISSDYTPKIFDISNYRIKKGTPLHGDRVTKSGRTTGVTDSYITSTYTVTNVYDGNKLYRYSGVLEFDNTDNAFVQGGDSGSVVVDSDNKVIGLIFAASPKRAFAIPFPKVLEEIGWTYSDLMSK